MKKFRLVLTIGNCENFGTEWEEIHEEVKEVEADNKDEVIDMYRSIIYDCDVRYWYIEEIGAKCYEVILDGYKHQFSTLDNAMTYFRLMEDQAEESIVLKVGVIE